MAIEFVTTHTGKPHITPFQIAALQEGILGTGTHVLDVLGKFEAKQLNPNEISIAAGACVIDGRLIVLDTAQTVKIENGGQTGYRNDIICIRYEKAASETASLVVVKGDVQATPSYERPRRPYRPRRGFAPDSYDSSYDEWSGYGKDPELNDKKSINAADDVVDLPLYRVVLNGIQISKPQKLFEVASSIASLESAVDEKLAKTLADVDRSVKSTSGYLASRLSELEAQTKNAPYFKRLSFGDYAEGHVEIYCRAGVGICKVVNIKIGKDQYAKVSSESYAVPYEYLPTAMYEASLMVEQSGAQATVRINTDGSIQIQNYGSYVKDNLARGQVVWFY